MPNGGSNVHDVYVAVTIHVARSDIRHGQRRRCVGQNNTCLVRAALYR